MKEIPLSQGMVALVDDEDFEWLNQWKWNATKMGNSYYAQRNPGAERRAKTGEKILKMHRVILNAPAGSLVDHADGNGLNNQRSNIRLVTKRQNSQNLCHVEQTSQYPGVSWYKRDQKWRASITINNKRVNLGKYNSEINAFKAYYDAVLELGETVLGFSYPDIPEDKIEIYVPNPRSNPKMVIGINATNPDDVVCYMSKSEAHRLGGFCITGIHRSCSGINNTHHGYVWRYVD